MTVTETQGRRALRITAVLAKTGLSRTHLYRLAQRDEFPKPVKLGERISVWDEAQIDAWLAEKFAGGAA